MVIAIGCGSNVGNKQQNILKSVILLGRFNILTNIEISPVYYSKALVLCNEKQEDYVNIVVTGNTLLSPIKLLSALKFIERKLQRAPQTLRWQPRVIDLDVLLYKHYTINEDVLTIPHAEMLHRDFVLCPLNHLAPHYYHPKAKKTIFDLSREVSPKHITGVSKFCSTL